ncbi:hypothetical protein Trydic_g5458 [Trypoxylus dichotomus]
MHDISSVQEWPWIMVTLDAVIINQDVRDIDQWVKPNKIDFNGLPSERILQYLNNEADEKLRHKIFTYVSTKSHSSSSKAGPLLVKAGDPKMAGALLLKRGENGLKLEKPYVIIRPRGHQ